MLSLYNLSFVSSYGFYKAGINITAGGGLCDVKVDAGPENDKLNVFGINMTHDPLEELGTYSYKTTDVQSIIDNKKGYVCEADGERFTF